MPTGIKFSDDQIDLELHEYESDTLSLARCPGSKDVLVYLILPPDLHGNGAGVPYEAPKVTSVRTFDWYHANMMLETEARMTRFLLRSDVTLKRKAEQLNKRLDFVQTIGGSRANRVRQLYKKLPQGHPAFAASREKLDKVLQAIKEKTKKPRQRRSR